MKIKNKGKVHPSPSSSSSFAAAANRDGDVLSVLKLLPAAILALASVLSLEDREVLAYMITRSLKTTITNPSSLIQDSKKKPSKKSPNTATNNNNNNKNSTHKAPIFDCDCFDCYRSYWFRWDSSPNRELIHQVIEAFEEHLNIGEQLKKTTRGKRRDKVSRRVGEKSFLDVTGRTEMPVFKTPPPEATHQSSIVVNDDVVSPDGDVSPDIMPEKTADVEQAEAANKVNEEVSETTAEMAVVIRNHAAGNSYKGLARKVLPDVLGLLNSRLWSLWGPNV